MPTHISEGELRRLEDEPEVISAKEREHLESCAVCRIAASEIHSDHQRISGLLADVTTDADPEAALKRLIVAIDSGVISTFEPPETTRSASAKRGRHVAPKQRAVKPRTELGFLQFVGRSFAGVGALILLFVGYQLIGTNFVTDKQQKGLASDLQAQWASAVVAEEKPNLGQGVALIKIPKIGLDAVVVEGVGVEDLKKGPGHYPGTAMPGQIGNMVISGHRTTYGAPFNRLDELKLGDEILVYDASGPNKYLVSESKIVLPTAVEVLDQTSDARLTLTTCNPKFSARQRLIIVAQLQGTPKGSVNQGNQQFDVVPGPS